MIKLDNLLTEKRNENSKNIDTVTTLEMVHIINEEDKKVAPAIEAIAPAIASAIDVISERLSNGGKLFYIGSGTSGRLGILDAVECPPTYSTDPSLVQGIIAGGTNAIFKAQEGAEDSDSQAALDLSKQNFSKKDVLVGLTASGRTPYVIGAMKYAKEQGATTISLSCTPQAQIDQFADIRLNALVGPEVVTGSTRMKAGTAQKLILNMLSTGAMIKLGKVYGNLMVDVKSSNQKLEERARRIVMEATGCDRDAAIDTLKETEGSCKLAIFMILSGLPLVVAKAKLQAANGFIARALKEAKDE